MVDGFLGPDRQHDREPGRDARAKRLGQRAGLVAAGPRGCAPQLEQLAEGGKVADRDARAVAVAVWVCGHDLRDAFARLDRDEERGLGAQELARLANECPAHGNRIGAADARGQQSRNRVNGVYLGFGHGRGGERYAARLLDRQRAARALRLSQW
jgi:hypothetical protein